MAFWGGRKNNEVEAEDIRVADIKVREHKAPKEVHTDKVVIVTGPTLGTILGFVALGAAIGAGAATFLNKKQGDENSGDAVAAGVSAGGSKDGTTASTVAARAGSLAERAKNLAGRAKSTVQSAAEAISPAVQDAIQEARSAAQKTEQELEAELAKGVPDAPADRAESKRNVVSTGSVAVGVPSDESVEVDVPANAEVKVPPGTKPVEVTEPVASDAPQPEAK